MNKQDLVGSIATDTGLTKVQAEQALNSLTENITGALSKGEKVTLVGFGTFSTARRAARMGRNPQTGTPISISATTVPKFKAGKDLKNAVR